VPDWTLVGASSNPLDPVTNFFKSSTWHFITDMFVFFIAVIWLSCAYWVFKDARRRIDDGIIVTVAVLTGLIFGPLGLLVYTIVRPPEYLEDMRERELEIRTLEQRLEDDQRCSYCKTAVREDYLVCPNCTRRLRNVCGTCSRPVEPNWRVCPYCESQVTSPAGLRDSYERLHS
jgi:RNA polymerase subunit RPABC4/transcription elongation factor Spt4